MVACYPMGNGLECFIGIAAVIVMLGYKVFHIEQAFCYQFIHALYIVKRWILDVLRAIPAGSRMQVARIYAAI